MTVLVVDDDAGIRDTVEALLVDEGYTVVTAPNGVVALAEIDRQPPCVVLLDMRMPVLDGWGVAAALRERGSRVPVVVMTAARDAQAWCDEIGGDACLAKPFELDAILAVVARFCRGAEPRA